MTSGDRPLGEALELMNKEGITSLAVVDNQYNVVGNISTVDVKVRTATCCNLYLNPQLRLTCFSSLLSQAKFTY